MPERVRALKGFSGPKGSHAKGEVFILPEGVDWIRAGLVEPVDGSDDGLTILQGKDAHIPAGFTGLRERGAGWYDVIVDGTVIDKIRGEEDAKASLEAATG